MSKAGRKTRRFRPVIVEPEPGYSYIDFLKQRMNTPRQPSYLDALSAGELRTRLNELIGEK